MMSHGRKVEGVIVRLAQMARNSRHSFGFGDTAAKRRGDYRTYQSKHCDAHRVSSGDAD